MSENPNDIAIARALVADLVAAFAPLRVLWFGSRAVALPRSDSDFDILVVAQTDLPLHRRLSRARYSTRHSGVARDIIVVTPEEFQELAAWPSSVVADAAATGLVMYERAA